MSVPGITIEKKEEISTGVWGGWGGGGGRPTPPMENFESLD